MDCFKKAALVLALMLAGISAYAQEYGRKDYAISVEGVYGYNSTWKHHGGANLKVFLPVHRNIHLKTGLEYLSPKVMSAFVTLRPVVKIGSGEIFGDASLSFRPYFLYSSCDLTCALTAGYRRDHFSGALGVSKRWMGESANGKWQSAEAVMVMYNVRACLRPSSSPWNLGAGICNYNDFVYERFWQPMVFIDGECSVAPHLRFTASAYIKPAGIFHQVATFYELTIRAGLAYIF